MSNVSQSPRLSDREEERELSRLYARLEAPNPIITVLESLRDAVPAATPQSAIFDLLRTGAVFAEAVRRHMTECGVEPEDLHNIRRTFLKSLDAIGLPRAAIAQIKRREN